MESKTHVLVTSEQEPVKQVPKRDNPDELETIERGVQVLHLHVVCETCYFPRPAVYLPHGGQVLHAALCPCSLAARPEHQVHSNIVLSLFHSTVHLYSIPCYVGMPWSSLSVL